MKHEYSSPLDKLITLGSKYINLHYADWPQYDTEFGLTQTHISDLIAILNDENLYAAYAHIHAWRALAQLKAVEAIPSLIVYLNKIDDEDDDWPQVEFPFVFSQIGPACLSPLIDFIDNKSDNKEYAKYCAYDSIAKIGCLYPEQRLPCIEILSKWLRSFRSNDDKTNAFIMCGLVDLKAVESIDLIREAFSNNCVDIDIQGDIEDVEIELCLRTNRSTPRKLSPTMQSIRDTFEAIEASTTIVRTAPKIGRNDLCPCHSGKKYKHCCYF